MPLHHEQQQNLIRQIVKQFDTDMVKTIAQVERLVNRILIREGFTEQTALNFQILFDEALEASGYYALVNKFIDEDFDKLFRSVRQGINLGGFDVKYTEEDLAKITALKTLQLDQFNTLGANTGRVLQQNLFRYVLSDFNLDDVQRQIMTDLRGTNLERYSTTLANTAIGDFQQSMIDIKAEGLDAVWLYIGVKDEKTRDYCKCVLNQKHFYTTEQKNRIMSNSARRFNCRHRARPVSEEFAEGEGFTSTGVLKCQS